MWQWRCSPMESFHVQDKGDPMKVQTLVAIAALTVSGITFAQRPAPSTPNLDKREANQEKRIDHGVTSGQLNAKESNRMDIRQDRLAADEAAAKSDGKVTRAERRQLQRQADRDSAAIRRQKHDNQTAMKATK